MKNITLMVGVLFLTLQLAAQLSGVKNIPSANYPHLQAMTDSLNAYGVASGGVSFMVAGGSVFNESPLTFTATGSPTATINIRWDGTGVKPVVNFTGTSSAIDAGFLLRGSAYFTIDGLDIRNPTGDLEFGIWLTNASATNGAHYNTIKNCIITLNKLNPFQTEAIRVVPQVTASSFDGNSHHNKFLSNRVQNATIGYSFDGAISTTALMGTGNEISTIDGGLSMIEDVVMAGVLIDDQNGFVLHNTIIQNMTRIGGGTTAPAAISTLSGNPSDPLTNDFHITGNTILNITSSTTSIYGMYISARKATYHIYNNKVHQVTASGGGGNSADGIMIFGTDIVANIYNNMVSGVAAPSSAITGNAASRGINVRTYSQANVFFNSVLLDFEAINPAHSSAAFIIFNNTDPVSMGNNVFVNKTVFPAGAMGYGAAFYKRTPALTNVMEGSDRNIYYAGVPSANNVIFYGHNASAPAVDQTLSAYKTRAASFDQNSFTEDVPFIAQDDLHIQPLATTVVRGNATQTIFPVPFDFDGSQRSDTHPDIGADEVAAPHPASAYDPVPETGSSQVSVATANVMWYYAQTPEFMVPTAFLVYFGTDPTFNAAQPIAVVNYNPLLPYYTTAVGALAYGTTYYWKVVPAVHPDNGPFAPEVGVWQFTTEAYVFPYPNTAQNPQPAQASTVALPLVGLSWEYFTLSNYTTAQGFKVYFGTSPDLNQAHYLGWVAYEAGQSIFSIALGSIVPEYATTYYWKVVPTVDQASGPEAQGVEIWSFVTQLIPWPALAVNPEPLNGGTLPLGSNQYVEFHWQYFHNPSHIEPVEVLVYGAADTTSVNWNQPILIIPYTPGFSNFTCNFSGHPNFSYQLGATNYWKVVASAGGNSQPNPAVETWSFVFVEYVGLPEHGGVKMSVFPNPASDKLSIVLDKEDVYFAEILDIKGKSVFNQVFSGNELIINVEKTIPGVYFLRLSSKSDVIIRKLVID